MNHTRTKPRTRLAENTPGSTNKITHVPIPTRRPAGATGEAGAGAGRGSLRVRLDDLDIEWGYQQSLWQGQPFTSVAFEEWADGSLISEADCDEGFQRGSREWYPDGQCREDKRFGPYGPDGLAQEWHSNGQPKSEALYEHGVALYTKAWDAAGKLTRETRLSETDLNHTELEERRRIAQTNPTSVFKASA